MLDASEDRYSKYDSGSLDYHHLPGVDYHKRLIYLRNHITTKFIVLQADDDFHGIQALSQGVDFLIKSPNFSSAQGSFIRFYSKRPFTWLPDYVYQNRLNIVDESPLERAITLSTSGMHFIYSIMRTEVFCEIALCLENIEVGILAMNELVFTLTLGLFGNYTTLQSFYSARDGVQSSINSDIRFEDWENSLRGEDFRIFKMNIVGLYEKNTDLSLSQANTLVTQIFHQIERNTVRNRQRFASEVQSQGPQRIRKILKSVVKKLVHTRMFELLYPYRKASTWIYMRNLIVNKAYFSFKKDLRRIKNILPEDL